MDLDLSKSQLYQLGITSISLIALVSILATSFYLHGIEATKTWIIDHPGLSFFLFAVILSTVPVYREVEGKLRKVWKQTNFVTILLIAASGIVYYQSFAVEPSSPLEAFMYAIAGKAFYFTGFFLILNLIGVPVVSSLLRDE